MFAFRCLSDWSFSLRRKPPRVSSPFAEPGLTLCPGQGWPKRADNKRRGKTVREQGRDRAGHLIVTQAPFVMAEAEQAILYSLHCLPRAEGDNGWESRVGKALPVPSMVTQEEYASLFLWVSSLQLKLSHRRCC